MVHVPVGPCGVIDTAVLLEELKRKYKRGIKRRRSNGMMHKQ
jgi:hypothetical protein